MCSVIELNEMEDEKHRKIGRASGVRNVVSVFIDVMVTGLEEWARALDAGDTCSWLGTSVA